MSILLCRTFLPVCLLAGIAPGSTSLRSMAEAPENSSPRLPPAPDWLKYVDQGGRYQRLKGYQTSQGVKLEIVAEDPTVLCPIELAFSDDGTPFVTECRHDPEPTATTSILTNRDGSRRTVATPTKRAQDVVKALRDTAGKWVFDAGKMVLEENFPSGILSQDGWLYLAVQETIRRYRAGTPGEAYDVREVIARGFATHLKGVSGLALGPDGLLYGAAGDGDHLVEGSDGSRGSC